MRQGILKDYGETFNLVAKALDLLSVLLGAYLAHVLRFGTLSPYLPADYGVLVLAVLLLSVLLFPSMGVYQSWRGRSLGRPVARVVGAWVVVFTLLLIALVVFKVAIEYSRLWLGLWAVITTLMFAVVRIVVHLVLRTMRRRGWNQRHVVIAGAGELGRTMLHRVRRANWTGFGVQAFFDDNTALSGTAVRDVPVLGTLDALPEYVHAQGIDEVWLALPLRAEPRMRELMEALRHTTVTIRFVPDIFSFRLLNHAVTEIAGMPVMDLTATPMSGWNAFIKAIEDRVLAILILLLISPLMLALAIGVKLSSPGPVFFRQERVGWNGRPFTMLKFRSMPVDAEAATGAVWARKGEQRATRFGAFLRRTSLDELPQFINVLKGDMSIVGPRPERPVFVDKFKEEIPDYMQKHLVKAGITGWAQVNGWRGDTDLNKRIEHDLYYIEHWSLWFDLKIILMTVFKGLVHENAY